MGVNACDRVGCNHIMCDTLVKTKKREYYVCESCYSELSTVLCNLGESTDKNIMRIIDDFMATEPSGEVVGDPLEFLKTITRC